MEIKSYYETTINGKMYLEIFTREIDSESDGFFYLHIGDELGKFDTMNDAVEYLKKNRNRFPICACDGSESAERMAFDGAIAHMERFAHD